MAGQGENAETKICKYCQSEIPKKAKICPHCRKKQGGGKLPMILGAVILCIILMMAMNGGDSDSSGSSSSSGAKSANATSTSTTESADGAEESSVALEASGNTYADWTAYDIYSGMQEVMGEGEGLTYALNEKASAFLKEHDDLFPAKGEIDAELVDYGVDYREILKNDTKFGDKLIYLPNLHANQIFEEEVVDGFYFTEINAVDYATGQYYYVFYNDEVNGVFDGDFIDVYGLPLGRSSFDNTGGGQTITIILGGAKIIATE